ncbi:uncharacterized protein BT62DRAFT_922425 [Guyanagaster necrorhizus]|uniref:Uncharacterized protein n=1 Tax=Guyanagaster necrorhizus TaxID=856835 RepID=A0A9P7VLU1_9AGAR|nr:uncharacterized protein BT62DRAFT_922425 [Guyanagaster necrorhizus MCA 3950]KAG7442710.1 hypothetical protein BT62DRAFT_922425 [Guyanagaster necrorhizus MCA 3950]
MIPTFIVVKAVIMSLCKDPATTVNNHFDQLQEYTICSHLEHYKSELTRDKNLKKPSLDEFKTRVIACNKGKGHAIHHSCVTIDTESDDDEDDSDKVAVHSDSDTKSIKIVIDEEAFRAGWFLKFSKARSGDVITGDKHKEPYKVRVFACYWCLFH